jgi:hypothetical protein
MQMTQNKTNATNQTIEDAQLSIGFANFFKSAQDLTEDEFNQVMGTLISKEARVRFNQQRNYGHRTFLQEGVDNNPDGLSDIQTERNSLGLPNIEKNVPDKSDMYVRKEPLVPWVDIPDILKAPRTGPITQEERDEAIELLKKLNGSFDDFLKSIK